MSNVDEKSKESAKKAQQLPPSVQYAIVQVMPNILNGAFWGFTDLAGIKEHIDALRQDKNIIPRKLSNACLLEVVPQYLLQAMMMIDPNILSQQDLLDIQKKMAEAVVEFEKFLVKRGKDGFSGVVGIYCINDTPNIRYKNVNYPAFRVNMNIALELLNKYGYAVKVGGKFVSASQAVQMGQALWESTVISPTDTGIMIEIKSTLPQQQMAKLAAEFKAAHSKK